MVLEFHISINYIKSTEEHRRDSNFALDIEYQDET